MSTFLIFANPHVKSGVGSLVTGNELWHRPHTKAAFLPFVRSQNVTRFVMAS